MFKESAAWGIKRPHELSQVLLGGPKSLISYPFFLGLHMPLTN